MSQNPTAFHRRSCPRRAGLRRGHGHRNLPAPRLHQSLFDELCLSDPKLIATDPSRLLRGRGRRADDQHLRGQPRWRWPSSAWPTRSARSTAPARGSPGEVADAAESAGVRGRLDRPAGRRSPAATQRRVEAMIVEQAAALCGGRGRFHPLRDAAHRGGHASSAPRRCGNCPTCPSSFPAWWPTAANRPPASRSSGCWPRCPTAAPQPIAWGMNCGIGPDGLLGAVERAVRLIDAAAGRAAQRRHPQGSREPPHLFLLARVSDRATPSGYVGLGASAVGGCCGTTPEHIREMALAVKPLAAAQVAADRGSRPRPCAPKPPAPLAEKSRLGERLAARPMGHHRRTACRRAATTCGRPWPRASTLHERGVDAINIPDGPRASARISLADHRRAHPARGAASSRSCTSAAATAT